MSSRPPATTSGSSASRSGRRCLRDVRSSSASSSLPTCHPKSRSRFFVAHRGRSRAHPRAHGRAVEPGHSAATCPIPGARGDDRAGPDRPLRHPPQGHGGEDPHALTTLSWGGAGIDVRAPMALRRQVALVAAAAGGAVCDTAGETVVTGVSDFAGAAGSAVGPTAAAEAQPATSATAARILAGEVSDRRPSSLRLIDDPSRAFIV